MSDKRLDQLSAEQIPDPQTTDDVTERLVL